MIRSLTTDPPLSVRILVAFSAKRIDLGLSQVLTREENMLV